VNLTPAATVSPSVVDFGSIARGGFERAANGQCVLGRHRAIRDQHLRFELVVLRRAVLLRRRLHVLHHVLGLSQPVRAGHELLGDGELCAQLPRPQSTTVYLCDNTSATPHSITLTGNGVVPPIIVFLPAQWDFGNVLVGQQSAVRPSWVA